MTAPATEDEFDALMDAISTVYGLRAGHTLTQADVDAISAYDANAREDEERALDAYHRGYQDGLLAAGGRDVADLNNKLDEYRSRLAVEKAMRKFDEQRGFRNGAAACRETMAAFVEQGGDPVTANSIRLNWSAAWGAEPDAATSPAPTDRQAQDAK